MVAFSFLHNWYTPNTYDTDFAALPNRPGVYLLVRWAWYPEVTHRVLYVGMSRNLRQRLNRHKIWQECEERNGSFDCVRVYFRTCAAGKFKANRKGPDPPIQSKLITYNIAKGENRETACLSVLPE